MEYIAAQKPFLFTKRDGPMVAAVDKDDISLLEDGRYFFIGGIPRLSVFPAHGKIAPGDPLKFTPSGRLRTA